MCSNSSIPKRIRAIQRWSGLTQSQFATTFNMVPQSLNNKLCGRTEFSLHEVQSIALYYKEISLDWLIRGDGPMLVHDCDVSLLSENLSALRSAIEDLENQQDDLKNSIDVLTETITS